MFSIRTWHEKLGLRGLEMYYESPSEYRAPHTWICEIVSWALTWDFPKSWSVWKAGQEKLLNVSKHRSDGWGDNGNIMEARGSHCPRKKRQTNRWVGSMQRLKIIPYARPELISQLYIVTRIRRNHYLLKSSVVADLPLSNVKSPSSSTVNKSIWQRVKDPHGKFPSLCTLSHWAGVWKPRRPDEAPGEQSLRLDLSPCLWWFFIICLPTPARRKDAHFQTRYVMTFSLLVLSCEI